MKHARTFLALMGLVGLAAVALGVGHHQSGGSASSETSLGVIDDWDESDRAKVNPIVGQAGVAAGAGAVAPTVPRVTLASDDPAVTALGTTDSAKADVDGDGSVTAQLRRLTYELDRVGDLLTDLLAVDATAWQTNATSADALAADLVVVAGTASKKLIIDTLNINVQTTMVITVKDEDDHTLWGPEQIPAGGLHAVRIDPRSPWRITTADKNLEISSDTAGTITAWGTGRLYD